MALQKHHSKVWDIEGSSNIAQISWYSRNNKVVILFHNGSEYQYEGVPLAEIETVANADSVGKAFNQLIKPNYEGIKIS